MKRLSKAIKLCHYLLTSPELGYKNVQFEYFYETNKSVDLYIHEIDLAIELDGPAHFFATMEEGLPMRRESVQYRKTNREINPLRLNYTMFDDFCKSEVDYSQLKEADFLGIKQALK